MGEAFLVTRLRHSTPEVAISPEGVLRRLGADPASPLSARLRRHLGEATERVTEAADLRSAQVTLSVTPTRPWVQLGGQLTILSRHVSRVLRHCDHAVVFVLTLGPDLDKAIQHAMESRPHFGTVLDAAASVLAEQSVQGLAAEITEGLAPGLQATPPYSPGYCDWPLTEQQQLFAALPTHPAGVRLTPDSLMTPRKSVSGVLGIGLAAAVARYGNACRDCKQSDCPHRRQGRNS